MINISNENSGPSFWTDQQILESIQTRQNTETMLQGWSQLIEKYHPMLEQQAIDLSSKDQSLVDDLVQSTWMTAYRSIEQSNHNLELWLSTILRHHYNSGSNGSQGR